MAWVKLDDDFFGNPKVLRAGRDARDLYLAGLCFCNRGLTDGFIPDEALRRLGADAYVDEPRALARKLVEVGLWSTADGGYLVHDYLSYQPSKDRVLATREVRAEAGSRGGKQKASNLLEASQTFASENFKQNSTPSRTRPVPVQDPEPDPAEETHDAPAALERAPYPPKFEKFWTIWNTPPTKGRGSKKLAADEWRTMKLERASDEDLAALETGLRAWRATPDWRKEGGRYIPHCHRWLKSRGWEDEPPESGPARASPRSNQGSDVDYFAAVARGEA